MKNKILLSGYLRLIKTICINLPIHINIIIMKTSIVLFNFLGPEMLVIFLAILLLFGGKKIPELMRGLGKGISEFKKGKNEIKEDLDD